jgi:type IX secretion system PorP/SprF family membrane protein
MSVKKSHRVEITFLNARLHFRVVYLWLAIGWSIIPGESLFAQDPLYSQFYNAPLQMNAAMAGIGRGPQFRLSYRNQWPGLGNIYTTYSTSYDQYIPSIKSGIGAQILTDNAGDGTLRTTGITGYYSYRLRLKNQYYIKGGMEAGFHHIALDWNKLLFGDAIDVGTGPISPGGVPYPSSEAIPQNASKRYLNLGAGVLMYSPDFYVGLGLKNVNSPDISFLTSKNISGSTGNVIPLRISIHGGKNIMLYRGNKNTEPTFIALTGMFQRQGGFYQVNGGAMLSVNRVNGGVWYRHSLYNGDAVIAGFGVKAGALRINYSFDLTLSGLGLAQGGSHEVGIGINFDYLYPEKQDYNDCFAIFR